MPIVDVEIVTASEADMTAVSTPALANALGQVFGSPPGTTWVRVHELPSGAYAENGVTIALSDLPAFATVLHSHPPGGTALAAEATAVTQAIARIIGRSPDCVHVQYAPAGAGRQAFGGTLVQ